MATWVTGETPAASKLQALDDRVTSLEGNRIIMAGGTTIAVGNTGGFTTSVNSRFTFANPLGVVTPLSVQLTPVNTSASVAGQFQATVVSTSSGNITCYILSASGATVNSTAFSGLYYAIFV